MVKAPIPVVSSAKAVAATKEVELVCVTDPPTMIVWPFITTVVPPISKAALLVSVEPVGEGWVLDDLLALTVLPWLWGGARGMASRCSFIDSGMRKIVNALAQSRERERET
jgi:hypothetical protein